MAQGGAVKPGDMLFVRTGWKEAYDGKTEAERRVAGLRVGKGEDGARYAGVAQEEAMLDWLHDCYFACVAGDAPAFEAWPTHEGEFCLAFFLKNLGSIFFSFWR